MLYSWPCLSERPLHMPGAKLCLAVTFVVAPSSKASNCSRAFLNCKFPFTTHIYPQIHQIDNPINLDDTKVRETLGASALATPGRQKRDLARTSPKSPEFRQKWLYLFLGRNKTKRPTP